jgi:hypothetical protein
MHLLQPEPVGSGNVAKAVRVVAVALLEVGVPVDASLYCGPTSTVHVAECGKRSATLWGNGVNSVSSFLSALVYGYTICSQRTGIIISALYVYLIPGCIAFKIPSA